MEQSPLKELETNLQSLQAKGCKVSPVAQERVQEHKQKTAQDAVRLKESQAKEAQQS